MTKKNPFKIVLFILWLSLIAGIFYVYWRSGVSVDEVPMAIRDWIVRFGIWGPIIFILLYAVRSVTLFAATAFTIASGIIFGPWLGMVYTYIGANLAANLAFMIGKYFGKDVVQRAGDQVQFFPKGEKFRENGFITVLMSRLLFFPYDWVGYLAGAYNFRHRDLALGTAIGIIPGLVAFVALGGALTAPLTALPLFLIFFVLGLVIAKFLKKTTLGRELDAIKKQGE